MSAQGSRSELPAWRLAGTIALAGVALVCREAIRFLDERSWRGRGWVAGDDRVAEQVPAAVLGDR